MSHPLPDVMPVVGGKQFRGVATVHNNVVEPQYHAAYERARRELAMALYEVLQRKP